MTYTINSPETPQPARDIELQVQLGNAILGLAEFSRNGASALELESSGVHYELPCTD